MSATSISSGELVPGTYVIAVGHNMINGVIVAPGGTVTIYDNTAASGKIVFAFVNAGTNSQEVLFNRAIRTEIGLTVLVATANAYVFYGAA